MGKLFLKIFALILLLVIVRIGADVVIPLDDVQKKVAKKLNEIGNVREYNLIFVGSSRIERGVIPVVIDSLLASHRIRSINLGYSSFTFPYIKNFLDTVEFPEQVKYIVVELNGPSLDPQNEWPWWKFVLAGIFNGSAQEVRLFCLEAIDKVPTMLNSRANLFSLFRRGRPKVVLNPNGYMPYEQDRTNNFPQPLLVNSEITADLYLKRGKLPENAHYYGLDSLIDSYGKKGIKLIFILPPVAKNELEAAFVSGAFHSLAPEFGLNVYSDAYEQLLVDSTKRLNYNHFNNEGAAVYSQILGKKLNEHLTKWFVNEE